MTDTPLAERLGKYESATLFEAHDAVYALSPKIVPLFRPISVSGPAYTVTALPGDNLAVHLAVERAPSGSVLVVTTDGNLDTGFWGEILTTAAQARGIRGLVTDGAVRDTRGIRALGFPVFSVGVAISGPGKKWPGVLGQPVIIGGVLVRPGDIVVGDDDGVVVVKPEAGEEVLRSEERRVGKEC